MLPRFVISISFKQRSEDDARGGERQESGVMMTAAKRDDEGKEGPR